MDFNKTSKLLKKFKGLHNTLRDSGQEPSTIEKDLLLSYLKELYEHVITIGDGEVLVEEPKKVVAETITASSNGHTDTYVAPKQEVSAPVVVAPIVAAPPVVEKIVAPEPVQTSPAVEAVPVSDPVPAAPQLNSALSGLFDDRSSNELSDRLNKLPITDINKAMGINEKILTINELFNGDQLLFSKTIDHLNTLTSFDEAKNYLVAGAASDLDWSSESKIKKADKFVQLLRRRYH